MAQFIKWFDTFVEEKNIPYTQWEIEANGNTHFIDNEVVMEHIKIASAAEQSQIKNVLVNIDFMDGDVNHFFKHLAGAIANNY